MWEIRVWERGFWTRRENRGWARAGELLQRRPGQGSLEETLNLAIYVGRGRSWAGLLCPAHGASSWGPGSRGPAATISIGCQVSSSPGLAWSGQGLPTGQSPHIPSLASWAKAPARSSSDRPVPPWSMGSSRCPEAIGGARLGAKKAIQGQQVQARPAGSVGPGPKPRTAGQARASGAGRPESTPRP